MARQREYEVGERAFDKSADRKCTIIKVVKSAIFPDWTCAYLVQYDHAPDIRYNMGSLEGIQFAKGLRPLKKSER